MIASAASAIGFGSQSPFTGIDICENAGLVLPEGTRRPLFDEDLWDFTHVIGLPVDMPPADRRLDFTPISDPRWRLVAKELIFALLVPRHPAVAPLPRAHRIPLHLRSCSARLEEAARLFAWLTARAAASLTELDDHACEAYLAFRRYATDEDGTVVGEQSSNVRAAALIVVNLVDYQELFTADRVRPDLRPWGGATANAVAEMSSGTGMNKTQPVPNEVLQPMLTAALHLTETIGPHAIELNQEIRENNRTCSANAPGLRATAPTAVDDISALLADYAASGTPLPQIEDHFADRRITAGWSIEDPLFRVSFGTLARQAGYRQLLPHWLQRLRPELIETVAAVGVEKMFARNASDAPTTDGSIRPWSLPLHRSEAAGLVGIVRTAAIITLAACSGMRACELMELRVGCRLPVEEPIPGLKRFRLASKLIKGQPLGGVDDQWIVIEPAYRATELLERLHEEPSERALLLSRFAFRVRYIWFRNWVNSPAGARLGLAAIPKGPVALRMLRRTLALEMAYRPGGVLATKVHMKHCVVATTEGYAARPGGAQAELLAEVNKHEAERNLELVLTEFRNYRNGILPAGPGARSLIDFFASIDTDLDTESVAAPKIQRNDRDILNLLSKRAKTLHIGPANYCWFTDPSRALCLKLAGTPTADRPLIGMCDSARCPQATHHQIHRPVWAQHAETTKTFLGQLGKTRTTERARLQTDHDRALRVIASIDTATTERQS
ncbi:site-specific integrase [Nocardia sp. CA-107356]|uniref:site-specific integrase n=1 Tax=Nocardia sp. CA-107356 TaxID=3239972 RepID=UPI003D9185F9